MTNGTPKLERGTEQQHVKLLEMVLKKEDLILLLSKNNSRLRSYLPHQEETNLEAVPTLPLSPLTLRSRSGLSVLADSPTQIAD